MFIRFACLLLFVISSSVALADEATAVAEPETKPAVESTDKAEAKPEELVSIELGEGAIVVQAPKRWARVKPRNRLIEVELAVTNKPAEEEQAAEEPVIARLTVMAAGGSVEQNIARWIGQFTGTEAGAAREKAKVEKQPLGSDTLHTVDISGTFMDSLRGPFGPKVEKPDHRLLAGILDTEKHGKYFFKLIGPSKVVEQNAKAFRQMLKSAEVE